MSCKCRSNSPLSYGSIVHCSKCSKVRWCAEQGSTNLCKIPTIEDGKIIEEKSGGFSNPFFSEIKKTPKRTRLHVLENWLSRKPHSLQDRFDSTNHFLSEFGLEIRRIYSENKIIKDESILLCAKGWTAQTIELTECPDGHPRGDSGGVFWQDNDNIDAFKNLGEILLGGYKKQQKDAISHSLENPGSLLITALPTGFGKTRIGQVITWLNRRQGVGGPTLLISPLIALMDDQRDQFKKFNQVLEENGLKTLNCFFLTAAEETPYEEILQKLKNDEVDVLCCSPETLLNPVGGSHWVEIFLQMKKPFSAMVVDEAHMVGEWGASIRPEFQLLGWVKDRLLDGEKSLRVILMSATITKSEEKELKKLFQRGLKTLPTIREPRIREDLSFNVIIAGKSEEDFTEEWIEFLTKERGKIPSAWYAEQANKVDIIGRPPLLVYTPKKRNAEGIIKKTVTRIMCSGNKKLVKSYTGETSSDQRNKLREDFVNDKMRALVATSAFGMGIDKTDVWTIAYLGMPHSLKGLYQGFGRAARGSHWGKIDSYGLDATTSQLRSGNCLAVIPDKQPRGFKAQLGKMKTMERVSDMFRLSKKAKFTSNGYAIVPVLPKENTGAYWSPHKEIYYDENDDEDDTMDTWSIEQELKQYSKKKEKERRKEMGRLKRKQALFQYNMWTIACLQRTEDVEFMGLHSPILSVNKKTGEEVDLFQTLEEGGYSKVLASLPNGQNPKISMPKRQERLAVLRFRKNIIGFEELKDMTLRGHKYLHDRHTKGRQELQKFLKRVSEGSCVRKSLAPAIGVDSADVKSCLETEPGRLQMPCNVCRTRLGFGTLKAEGFLWSEQETILRILGQKVPSQKISLHSAKFTEMRNLVEEGMIEGLISRGNEIHIPRKLTKGSLTKIGRNYPLFSIEGRKLRDLMAFSAESFSDMDKLEWPDSSTAILIITGKARIVGDSVYDKDKEVVE